MSTTDFSINLSEIEALCRSLTHSLLHRHEYNTDTHICANIIFIHVAKRMRERGRDRKRDNKTLVIRERINERRCANVFPYKLLELHNVTMIETYKRAHMYARRVAHTRQPRY